jgi:hypothetical protein
MNPTPPTSPVERLFAMLHRLLVDIGGRVSWSTLSPLVVAVMHRRIQGNKFRIERIVTQIRAGTYRPRRRTVKPSTRASPNPRPPRPPSLLPATFGWLVPLIPARPEEYWHANGIRDGVESFLNHPEMVALVAAAPVGLGRPLRSICWMVGLRPPPHLAPLRPPKPPAEAPKPAAKPRLPRPAPLPSRPPTRPDAPAWMQNWPPPVRGSRKLA